jgi:hypothetical protein
MEHGSLGEARVNALLLQRFWVLQRSVDVDGTDFLVQIRPASIERFLDRPVRLGRIQAKFVESEDRYVYVPQRHVLDPAGNPYPMFFLILSTGLAEGQQMFVLDASEIAEGFGLGDGDKQDRYSISAKTVFIAGKYEVVSQARTLERIENAVARAGRSTWANFLGLLDYSADPGLADDYRLPLYNWYGDFEKSFVEVKDDIGAIVLDMEEALDALREIERSADPLAIEKMLEARPINDFHGTQYNHHLSFSFGQGKAFNEDFFGAAADYRQRLDRLRSAGIEAPYVKLCGRINGEVQRIFRRLGATAAGQTIEWTLDYDPKSWAFGWLPGAPVPYPPAPKSSPPLYLAADPVYSNGRIVALMGLPPYPPDPPRKRFGLPAQWAPPDWSQFVGIHSMSITSRLGRLVEATQFGDQL